MAGIYEVSQQVLRNDTQAISYGQLQSVAAGSSGVLCELSTPAGQPVLGLSVGFGLGRAADWSTGVRFEFIINGRLEFTVSDQIADLLRLEFLPWRIAARSSVILRVVNASSSPISAAALIRLET